MSQAQISLARLVATSGSRYEQAFVAQNDRADQLFARIEAHQSDAFATGAQVFQLFLGKEKQSASLGHRRNPARRHWIEDCRWQNVVIICERDKLFSGPGPGNQVFRRARKPESIGAGEQDVLACLIAKHTDHSCAKRKVEQTRYRNAVAPAAGKSRRCHAVDSTVAANEYHRFDATALLDREQCIAFFEGPRRRVYTVSLASADPAFVRQDHAQRLVQHGDGNAGALGHFDQGAARVSVALSVFANFLRELGSQVRRFGKQLVELRLLQGQRLALILNLDRLQLGQLTQADFENIVGLPFAEIEGGHQVFFWIIRVSDNLNNLVYVD